MYPARHIASGSSCWTRCGYILQIHGGRVKRKTVDEFRRSSHRSFFSYLSVGWEASRPSLSDGGVCPCFSRSSVTANQHRQQLVFVLLPLIYYWWSRDSSVTIPMWTASGSFSISLSYGFVYGVSGRQIILAVVYLLVPPACFMVLSCVFHGVGSWSLSVVSAVTYSVAKLSPGYGGCKNLSSFWCVIVYSGFQM